MQVDSTPLMVANTYATMRKNLDVVRRRVGRPLTLADKILLGHLVDPENQDVEPGVSQLSLNPDRVALQDVLGQTVMLNFMQTMRDSVAVPTTVHCDHLIQARVEGDIDLVQSMEENKEVYEFLKNAAAKYGAGFWGPRRGNYPSSRLGKLRIPRCANHRDGFPHAERGWNLEHAPSVSVARMPWRSWQACLGKSSIRDTSGSTSRARRTDGRHQKTSSSE